MDLSALIFVALAVAWALYLIPKALKHHDEVVRSRSVEKFSHTMRVLARREPVDRRNARLVVSPVRSGLRPPVETKPRTSVETVARAAAPSATPVMSAAPAPRRTPSPQAERAAARRAAKRRRNVLAVVVTLNLVVLGLAIGSVVAWPWTAAPATLLVAWLVACRVSVRSERAQRGRTSLESAIEVGAPSEADADPGTAEETDATGVVIDPVPAAAVVTGTDVSPAATAPEVTTGDLPVVGGWDMVPTTLPTYVGKPAAQRRTVSTIDLDSTGVWSSGHSDEDSALARSAEQSARAARESEERRRASGA